MNGRFLLRCGFHTILSSLLLAIIMTASLAWPQSDEPVHVVPRKTIEQPVAETSVASIGSEPKLNAHVRPLRAGVDLVLVPVTITDALNRPVSDLAKSDFAVYEDNKQQEIRVFSKEDAPISIGLILDFSKSMTNKFEIERAAVSEFVKNANPQDDYFAIAFSDRPRLIADSTQSIDDLRRRQRPYDSVEVAL